MVAPSPDPEAYGAITSRSRAAGLDEGCIAGGLGLRFDQAVHHLVFEEHVQAVEAAEAGRNRLTVQIEAMLPDWELAPVVAALQTMRVGQCRNAGLL